jgi:uncharacterized protein (UPF0261 family)
LSSLDATGQPFFDPSADEAFVTALRAGLRPGLEVELLPGNINDGSFARCVAKALLTMMEMLPTTNG